mmetsp:Transcript_5043/g.14142  ORF Transcript_5043/g.14142 Transcript_5043/m.14142 type:complete len:854 (+) Transcript_5043:68-2629(+)
MASERGKGKGLLFGVSKAPTSDMDSGKSRAAASRSAGTVSGRSAFSAFKSAQSMQEVLQAKSGSLDLAAYDSAKHIYDELFSPKTVKEFLENSVKVLVDDVIFRNIYDLWENFEEVREAAQRARDAELYLQECAQGGQAVPQAASSRKAISEMELRCQIKTLMDNNQEFHDKAVVAMEDFVQCSLAVSSFLFGAFVEVRGLEPLHDKGHSDFLLNMAMNCGVAPFGISHTQLRIGHLAFSRHQVDKEAAKAEQKVVSHFVLKQLSGRRGALDIALLPVKISVDMQKRLLALLWCPYPEIPMMQLEAQKIATESMVREFYSLYPKERLENFSKVIFEWSRKPYDNKTANCHHFVKAGMDALALRLPGGKVRSYMEEYYHDLCKKGPQALPSKTGGTPREWLTAIAKLRVAEETGSDAQGIYDVAAYALSTGKYFFKLLAMFSVGLADGGQQEVSFADLRQWGIASYKDLLELKNHVMRQLAAVATYVLEAHKRQGGGLVDTIHGPISRSHFTVVFTKTMLEEEVRRVEERKRRGYCASALDNFIGKVVFNPPVPPFYLEEFATRFILTPSGSLIPIKHVAANGKNRPTILYSHGNSEDLYSASQWAEHIAVAADVNVLCYDYSGYGWSLQCKQEMNEATVYADALAVYQYALNTLKVPLSQLILYGRSLGGAPTVFLAFGQPRSFRIGGVVLEAAFANLKQIADEHVTRTGRFVLEATTSKAPLFPTSVWPAAQRNSGGKVEVNKNNLEDADKNGGALSWFNNLKIITSQKVTVKDRVLIIHGDNDDVVSFENAKMIRAAFGMSGAKRKPRNNSITHVDIVRIPGKGHNDLWTATLPLEKLLELVEAVAAGACN